MKSADSHKNISKVSTKIQEDSLNVDKIKQQTICTEGDYYHTTEDKLTPVENHDLISDR